MIQVRLRSISFALVVVVSASALVACGEPATPMPHLPGHSHRPAGGPTVPAKNSAETIRSRWDRWEELPKYRVATPRAPTQHLGGDHEAETLASPEAAAYPDLGPARSLPEGSVLVERLYPTGSDTADVIFAMVRLAEHPDAPAQATAEDPSFPWEMLVVGPDGMIEERGAGGTLETCVRCHAEAPHAGIFGRAQ